MTPRSIVAALLLAATTARSASPVVSLETALALYDARQFSAARTLFQAAARTQPSNTEIDFYLGRIALWFNDDDQALVHLEAAAAVRPNDAGIQNALGDLYGLRAQDASLVMKPHWACKCRAAYERAIELAPDQVRYRYSLLGFCLLAPSFIGGGIDRARAQANAIAKLDPLQGRIANATIDLQTRAAPDAFAQFDAVLDREPDNFLALYHVGRCAAISGQQLDRGQRALRRCLELARPPTADAPTFANIHQRLGDILAQRGDAAGAKAEYTLVHQLEPDFRPQKLMLRY